ncbi:hypothetical protein GGH20_005209, partial [Coemansia sp. RSA 1937]
MAKDRFLAQGVTHTKRQRGAHGQKDQKNQKNQRSQKSRMRSHGSDGSESDGVGDISDLEHQYEDASDAVSSADEFLETPAEKRLRLAKDYIGRVQASTQMAGGIDAEQID